MLCLTGVHVLISVAKVHQGLQTTRLSYSDLNRISSSVISCRKKHAPAPSLLDILSVLLVAFSFYFFLVEFSLQPLLCHSSLAHHLYMLCYVYWCP